MSARKLLALLVVVALGLLLICPTALSRPGTPLHTVGDSWGAINPDDDEEDPDIPHADPEGDDDNWDKSAIRGHTVAESCGGGSREGTGAGSSSSEDVLSLMEVSLSVRLALLLQSWVIFSSLR